MPIGYEPSIQPLPIEQASSNMGGQLLGMAASFIGYNALTDITELLVSSNAIGTSRGGMTGRLLKWLTRGRIGFKPLDSVVDKIADKGIWAAALNPSYGFIMPNKDMSIVTKASNAALKDFLKVNGTTDIGQLFTKTGGRLALGSLAGVFSIGFGVTQAVQMADLGLTLGKALTDQFAEIGQKYLFAPWSYGNMSDASRLPTSPQFQAMNQQAVSQLMQSRQLIAQGVSVQGARQLYNDPYDFYNFI